MKITLNQDPSFPETEVIINCPQADEDILHLVAMLRIHQKKLVGILDGERHLLDVKEILYIDTADKRTFLYTVGAAYECALRLYELEEALQGLDFLRAGRSAIVNFRRIQSIRPELGGRMLVTMDNGERLYVSRQYAAEMKEKLREVERSILK
ncbi:MAG: LytTR family transcriptional regulator DNA-binding domain-containing protein [Oscillospiraceae bacterium]|nr:LytTR family transcriptional regulator DNA-binding domain-containing protein [Oscillospiraceae bacterium]